LEVQEFDVIYQEIESRYEEYEIKCLSKKRRKRDVGAGRSFKLALKDRLLMLLVYYRLYVTYGIMGNKFRNSLRRYDRASSIVSGLVNFRIMRAKGMSLF
jgi:hypothetical protein